MSKDYSIQALTHRLMLLIGRGKVQSSNDDGPVQILQARISAKEIANIRRLAEFGFTSRPLPGADVVVVFVAGDRSNGAIIATGDQRYRFKLENDGEVALHDAFGKSIWFKKDGGIEIEMADSPITINNANGITVNSQSDITLHMNGADVIIDGPGLVQLAGAGGKKVVLDGDPVVAGVVHATSTVVTAK